MCNKFAELLNQKKKKHLNKFSKQNPINSQEFVDFIFACKSGFIPLKHQMNYFDYVPKHLETKECDYQTFIKGGESNSDKNKSMLRRMINAHDQRKYLVGHMFRSLENIKEWHFVYF